MGKTSDHEFPWKELLDAEGLDTGVRPDFSWLVSPSPTGESDGVPEDGEAGADDAGEGLSEENIMDNIPDVDVPEDEQEPETEPLEKEEDVPYGSEMEDVPEEDVEEVAEEETPMEEEDAQEEETDIMNAFLHVSPSQEAMFQHLSMAEKAKKKGIACILIALLFLAAGILIWNVTVVTFGAAAALMGAYAAMQFKIAKEEESFVSDVKRGYLRIEEGVLHCEQGVGTQYESIHLPVSCIKETLVLGTKSTRYLILSFDKDSARMLVNGEEVEEEIYEIRGGLYEEKDWEDFVGLLCKVLPTNARFDPASWKDGKHAYLALLVASIVLVVLSIVLAALIFAGIIQFVA